MMHWAPPMLASSSRLQKIRDNLDKINSSKKNTKMMDLFINVKIKASELSAVLEGFKSKLYSSHIYERFNGV